MPDDDVDVQPVRGSAVGAVPVLSKLLGLYRLQSHPGFAYDFDQDEANERGGYDANQWWQKAFTPGATRFERYRIFDEMDNGLVASILDLYAEEATQPDYDTHRSVWCESSDDDIVKQVDVCLSNIMAEDKATSWARAMCKRGDVYRRTVYRSQDGVLGSTYVDPRKINRVDDKLSRLVGFKETDVKGYRGDFNRDISWPWDYVHFRLQGGKNEDTEYGSAVLDPIFQPWRQLTLMEDAVLMYRMRRSPDRNLVLVDVGNMEEHEAVEYVNTYRKRFRKSEFIDPASPDYRKNYNPLTPLEDIFLPIRGQNNSTRIESLSGSANQDSLADLDHYRRKFFGSARVPQAFLGFEGDINAKATLTTQSIQFATTCKRVQKALIYGFRQFSDLHLTLRGTDFSKAEHQYLIKMAPISALDELTRLELVQLRMNILEAQSNLAQGLGLDVGVWAAYLLVNYAKLPEHLVLKLLAKPLKPEKDPEPRQPGETAEAYSHRKAVAYMRGIGTAGFTQLTESEQRLIAKAVHTHSGLRKTLGDLHELNISDLAVRQTDPTLLPPLGASFVGMDIGIERTQLNEDLARVRVTKTKQLNG